MIATLLSFLPSWAPTFGAGGMALLGVGLLGYSLLPLVQAAASRRRGRHRVPRRGLLSRRNRLCAVGVRGRQDCATSVAARDRAIAERDALIEDQNERIRRVQALNTRAFRHRRTGGRRRERRCDVEVSKLEEDLRAAGKGAGCDFTDDEYRRVRELIDRARRPATGNRAPQLRRSSRSTRRCGRRARWNRRATPAVMATRSDRRLGGCATGRQMAAVRSHDALLQNQQAEGARLMSDSNDQILGLLRDVLRGQDALKDEVAELRTTVAVDVAVSAQHRDMSDARFDANRDHIEQGDQAANRRVEADEDDRAGLRRRFLLRLDGISFGAMLAYASDTAVNAVRHWLRIGG